MHVVETFWLAITGLGVMAVGSFLAAVGMSPYGPPNPVALRIGGVIFFGGLGPFLLAAKQWYQDRHSLVRSGGSKSRSTRPPYTHNAAPPQIAKRLLVLVLEATISALIGLIVIFGLTGHF